MNDSLSFESTQQSQKKSKLLGLFSAFVVLLLWSHWIVFSRYGVFNLGYTPLDLVFLRYITAMIVCLPIIVKFWPYHKKLHQIIFVALSASGIAYSLAAIIGFQTVPAAEASLYTNGLIGLFSMIIFFLWAKKYSFHHSHYWYPIINFWLLY